MSLAASTLARNCENLVGAVEVPVGVAGPLSFRGHLVEGPVYLPIATTEGGLIASATRGALAISDSGGVTARVLSQRMVRTPIFIFTNLDSVLRFVDWVRARFFEIRDKIAAVSCHACLVALDPLVMGRFVHLSFVYETGDAAGQNMTTTCTWHACQWITEELNRLDWIRPARVLIECNLSADKKVSYSSFLSGRGTRVVAECFLENRVIERVLRLSPEQLMEGYHLSVNGATQSGTIGHNINIANIIAGVFIATGQDVACVHESSVGHFTLQREAGGVYASMLLPALIVGTVGGGTHLPRQRELREMMGCAGGGSSPKLAEIIAGFCLALDLSTGAAVAGGQFAAAHERLGRNRPVRWFTKTDVMTTEFFRPGLRRMLGCGESLEIESVEALEPLDANNSILTQLTSRSVDRLIGHFPVRLRYRTDRAVPHGQIDLVLKVKPLDREVITMANAVAVMCGGRAAAVHRKFRDHTGFAGCHTRELEVYAQTDPRFRDHVPAIYDIVRDDSREAYILVMENLAGMTLLNSADDIGGWHHQHVEAAIDGLARLHSLWYRREAELLALPWIGIPRTAVATAEMGELWQALLDHAADEFPNWFTREDVISHQAYIDRIREWWPQLDRMPKTLVHNDFNPRNLAFRQDAGRLRLCAYDWELATAHVPQHDLAELLCFVLRPDCPTEDVDNCVERHRRALECAAGASIHAGEWRHGFALCLRDILINRMGLYLMVHTIQPYRFVGRVLGTLRHLVRITRV
jgi:NADP-dependent 3-hydroxy-3-methylglutaryl-CoA reductase